MIESTAELAEWSRLYQAAICLKEMAPWEWMTETDIFGVENPETGELGFASVMGLLGEHYAVAVYLGAEGLYGFWHLEAMAPSTIPPEIFFQIPQLQASFEDRNELTPKDRDVIKKLGLKFRGRQAWPRFRCHRPGYFPWYLEPPEVRFLTSVLEQTKDVAARFRQDRELLSLEDEQSYLVRVCPQGGTGSFWEDRVVQVSPPEPVPIPLKMDMAALEILKGLPLSRVKLEMDFFLFPARIGERGTRPSCAYSLMMVEDSSGFILGQELLSPEPTLEAMYGLVPLKVVRQLARVEVVPKEVRVRSTLLFQLLQPLAEELKIKVKRVSVLRALDPAKEFLMQRFS